MIRGASRVLLGGSWNNIGRNVRSANRNRNATDNRNQNIGFRLALVHARVDALFDPIIILFAVFWFGGKKQKPFGMLVDLLPDACRSGELKECAYVIC
jgi:hypothetical protein